MEMEETLMEENENNMGKIGFSKVYDNTITLLISYFLFSPLQVCFKGGNLGYTNLGRHLEMMRWLRNARFVTLVLSVVKKIVRCKNAECGWV